MATVKPPRLERHEQITLAGLKRHHSHRLPMTQIGRAITRQWHEFLAMSRGVPGLSAGLVYGVCEKVLDGAEGIDYFAGVPFAGQLKLPEGFTTLPLPPALYAVFQHREHVAKLYDTYRLLFGTVLPGAGLKPADGPPGVPEWVERYGEGFDPETGLGGLEVLIPIED
jgi:AraC family transcriptional regulator